MVQVIQVLTALLVGVLFYYNVERKPCETEEAIAEWQLDEEALEEESWTTWRGFWAPALDYCTEDLTVVDALYLSIVTMTTVGYGDITPTSNGSRFFTAFYILVGFMFVFATFQSLFADVLTRAEVLFLRACDWVERGLQHGFGHAKVRSSTATESVQAAVRTLWGDGPRPVKPGDRRTRWRQTDDGSLERMSAGEEEPPPFPAHLHSTLSRDMISDEFDQSGVQMLPDTESYDLTHPAFHPEGALRFYARGGAFYIMLLVLCVTVGAACFAYIEEREYTRSGYFCFVSLSTVGFGDETPVTQKGRVFVCLYLLICVVLISAVINKVAALKRARQLRLRKVEMLRKHLDWDMIKRLDRDNGRSVTKLEFVVGMLVILGLVEADDVEPFLVQFDILDRDGSGELDREDLKNWVERNRNKYAGLQREHAQTRRRSSIMLPGLALRRGSASVLTEEDVARASAAAGAAPSAGGPASAVPADAASNGGGAGVQSDIPDGGATPVAAVG